jgi:hypothetical protein
MKCSELKELLSAYTDNELSRTQKEFVEEHLISCSDCRAVLERYRIVRDELEPLKEILPLANIKERTMLTARMSNKSMKSQRWLRPAFVAVSVTVIIAILLSLYFSGLLIRPMSVIAKAYAATEALQSFKVTDDEYMQEEETSELYYSFHSEFDYAGSSRYHLVKVRPSGGYSYEAIIIGDQVYSRGDFSVQLTKEQLEEVAPIKEKTLEALDTIKDIEKMPDEKINGIEYYHYKGTIDMEKWLEKTRNYRIQQFQGMIDRNPTLKLSLENMLKASEDMWRTKNITNEFWISKDDYLIRRWRQVVETLPGQPVLGGIYTAIATFDYFDFNKPIQIEVPITISGELLPGWEIENPN